MKLPYGRLGDIKNTILAPIWYFYRTKNKVTNMPPLPGTNFGGTKKETEVRMINTMQGM